MYSLELEHYQTNHLQSVLAREHRIHQSLLEREMQYHDFPVSNLRNVTLQGSGLYVPPLPKYFGEQYWSFHLDDSLLDMER